MEIKIISPIKRPVTVEKDVPLPVKLTHYSVLPFHEMEIGDSFFLERGQFKKKYFYDLKAFIYQMSKKYCVGTGHQARFVTNIERLKNGVRCFRIE